MATNNPIELLIGLNIDSVSARKNIQTFLDTIKKDMSINLDFNVNSSSIKNVSSEVDKLENKINNVGNTKNSKAFEGFNKGVAESRKSVEELTNYLKAQGMKYTLQFTTDANGQQKVKKVLTETKNELGEINKLTIKPIFDRGDLVGFKQVSETLANSSRFNLGENISKAVKELANFARQGELSNAQYEQLRKSITSSTTNEELKKVVDSMKTLNKEISHDNKMSNVMSNLNKQSLELSQKLQRLTGANKEAFDTKVVDKYIDKIDKLASKNITTKSGATRANNEFKALEKEINTYTQLQLKYQDTTRYLELMRKQNKLTSDEFSQFSKKAKLSESITQLSTLNKEVANTIKNKNVTKEIESSYKNLGTTVDTLQNKVNRLVQTYGIKPNSNGLKSIQSDLQKISSMEIKSYGDIDKLNNSLASVKRNIAELSATSSQMKTFDTAITRANTLLEKMRNSSAITTAEIRKFESSLSRIGTGNLSHVNNLIDSMNKKLSQSTSSQKFEDSINAQVNSLRRLDTQLLNITNTYKKAFNTSDAEKLRAEIQRINQLQITNPTQLRNAQIDINNLRENIRRFGAETQETARQSMNLGDMLVNAFKKFSIWMTASTIFYGTVRSIQDMTERVIELDTSLTNIARVTNDTDYALSTLFEKAIENVDALSGKTADYLQLVSDFTRTGLNIDESLDMANTATLLQNISELKADEAFDSLTAAMISFKMEAEDSLLIANKLNEVNIISLLV